MHVLVTTDTVGGVWTYTRELVTGLVTRGVQVTLVSFGGIPGREQRGWLAGLSGVRYYPTNFGLEWMQDAEEDIAESRGYLQRVVADCRPDLLHLSQFCFGDLKTGAPSVVVAHSDVLSWFAEVRNERPDDSWFRWYRQTVRKGLAGARAVVAPSHWMLHCLEEFYGPQENACVIYNGRSPELLDSSAPKEQFAFSAGRLWDEGKGMDLFAGERLPLPIHLAGAASLNGELDAQSTVRGLPAQVQYRGQLAEQELRELLGRASLYIATSRYEPFGLTPLEAALSGCALLVNDIPSLREVWGDAAIYFQRNDSASLRKELQRLRAHPELCTECGARARQRALSRYSATRMVDEYLLLYSALLELRASAA